MAYEFDLIADICGIDWIGCKYWTYGLDLVWKNVQLWLSGI